MWYGMLCGLIFMFATPLLAAEDGAQQEHSDAAVMGSFTSHEIYEGEAIQISDQKKRIVLFTMGISLLILLLTTATLGIAMVVHGKQVFVAHMIFAGLSVTLAIAHSVVAIVWFFPF